ncbi:MAG: glycosyltransferase family 10 [bacterium]|nr:glycosyltransferase family 10 [bacterium]
MVKVKITTSTPGWRLIRQTPESKGIWGNCQFFIDLKDTEEADWWIINGGINKKEKTICPPKNVVLIAGEPESIRSYDQDFLNQFPTIITSQLPIKLKQPNVIHSQTGSPWFINYHSNCYDEMKAVKSFQKEKNMSVIASIKSLREGQRKRLELVDSLKKHFGDRIDVFGGGINNVHDKWDGIAPYKYHVAIENGSFDEYWSEKLADTYLGGAYPFYYGCTNLTKYFPADSFTYIDVNDHKKTIETIEHAIANNYYEQRLPKIFEARSLVLDKYNLFAMLSELCTKPNDASERKEIHLMPEKIRVSPSIEKLQKIPFLYKGLRKIYRKYLKDEFNANGRLFK